MSLWQKAMMLLTIARARAFATRAAVRAPTTRLMSAAAWEALGLNGEFSDLVSKQWPEPNAVQRAALPALLKQEDDAVVGAETGSGKTLAYLLPAAQRAVANRRKHTPYPAALVLVPTANFFPYRRDLPELPAGDLLVH